MVPVKVTVGICAKDCESSVKHIVEIISNQIFPHDEIEVLFVEEDSKDGTLLSILKYAPNINMKYQVYHITKKGLGYSRNLVLKKAQGKYIIWIDDGTVIPNNYIRELFDFMEKCPTVGIATGILEIFSGSNIVVSLDSMCGITFGHESAGKFTKKLPGTGGGIFRVKAMMKVGGFDECITGAAEDTDIAYRILTGGWKIFIKEIKYSRDYSNNLGKIWAKGVWYGYGLHFLLHKHNELSIILCKSTPFAGFLEGIVTSFRAYKITHNKVAFLLPVFLLIQRTASFWGFIKAHNDSYGHFSGGVSCKN